MSVASEIFFVLNGHGLYQGRTGDSVDSQYPYFLFVMKCQYSRFHMLVI
jgi:hypothetical protein